PERRLVRLAVYKDVEDDDRARDQQRNDACDTEPSSCGAHSVTAHVAQPLQARNERKSNTDPLPGLLLVLDGGDSVTALSCGRRGLVNLQRGEEESCGDVQGSESESEEHERVPC